MSHYMPIRPIFLLALWTACMGEAPPGIDDSNEAAVSVAVANLGPTAQVAGTGGAGLRLRSGPGSTFAIVAVMPEGTVVDVVDGPSDVWFEVRYAGTLGWAHGDFLRAFGGKNNLLPWTANTAFFVTQGHNGGSHTGLGAWAWDFGTPIGTPIRAAHFGTVRLVKGNSTVGGCSSVFANDANFVIVDQGNGYESLYLHLSSVNVVAGQAVSRGDLIGHSGQTGWSCGPHLHFQVQLSPSNGGGPGFYNPSIHDFFYDPDFAWDPPPGALATSKNGISTQPATTDPHGGAGEAWDEAMRAASELP